MAEINNKYEFGDEELFLIYTLSMDTAFTFKDWGHEALESLRCSIRDFYRNEQKGICVYCRKDISLRSASNCQVEHVAPKSLYPEFIFEARNLCVICADCNEIKREQESLNRAVDTVKSKNARDRYPRTSNSFMLVHPHFDIYSDHIEIVGNYFYVDKTKKGHFTIGACRLNRKLYEFGWQKEFVDEGELATTMGVYLKEKNSIKRAALLHKLRHQLINT